MGIQETIQDKKEQVLALAARHGALNCPVCFRRCATIGSFLTPPYHSNTTLSTGPKKREYYSRGFQGRHENRF